MKAASNLVETIKSNYVIAVVAILGVFAFASAVLISWPALAYLGSKLLA
jgi:hypothetical protein